MGAYLGSTIIRKGKSVRKNSCASATGQVFSIFLINIWGLGDGYKLVDVRPHCSSGA
jgi:hypothetical protein